MNCICPSCCCPRPQSHSLDHQAPARLSLSHTHHQVPSTRGNNKDGGKQAIHATQIPRQSTIGILNKSVNTKGEYIPKIQIGKWPCPALLLLPNDTNVMIVSSRTAREQQNQHRAKESTIKYSSKSKDGKERTMNNGRLLQELLLAKDLARLHF